MGIREVLLTTTNPKSPYYCKFSAKIDEDDYEKVEKHNWSVAIRKKVRYAVARIDGKVVFMHTFLTGFKLTDHIDRDGLNNQRSNLREATRQQNNINKPPKANGSSKFKGVYWYKRHQKWHARVRMDNKTHHLGYFSDEKAAARAYNKVAKSLHGEFAYLNVGV